MSSKTTEIIESISIDGPIGLGSAVVIGILLALIFGWMLWSQRRATGGWAAGFWAMRVIAAGLVLCMLLGPSWVTQQRVTTPQSVAILVDTSDSMDVSDPPTSPRQQRWTQSASGGPDETDPLTHCDRAAVSLHVASHRCIAARDAVSRHQAIDRLRRQFDSLQQAIDRSSAHLESGLTTLSNTEHEAGEEVPGRLQRLLTLLQGQISHDTRQLSDSLTHSDSPASRDLSESLLTLEDSLRGAERRLKELTRRLERSGTRPDLSASVSSSSGLSRREHVARTLSTVRELTESSPDTSVTIQPFRFDEQAVPASLEDGWQHILQTSDSPPRSASSEDPTTTPARTSLSAALEQLNRSAVTDAIRSAILISDGGHNDPDAPSPRTVAATLGNIPVHVVPIGETRLPRDLLLHRVDVPTVVVQHDAISIDVIATAFQCAGESSKLVLRQDGLIVEEQPLTFSDNRSDHRTFFQVPTEELGQHSFELTVEPLEGEANTTNNVVQVTVNVVTDTLRVLLADRIARWEYRYLEQLFRRDESVTFDRLLFQPEVRASGAIVETGTLPRDLEEWSRYDVIILGDVAPQELDSRSQQALDEFVRTRGGQLIVIGGGDNMPAQYTGQPVMELLPVEQTRPLTSADHPQIALTSAGRMHEALTLSDDAGRSEQAWYQQYQFLPLHTVSDYSRPKPTAETLIAVTAGGQRVSVESDQDRTPDHAFLCWHRVGAGRVVYISSPTTYHLRIRQGDRRHHRFWGQMLRWLTAADRSAGTQTVRVQTDRIRYNAGDTVDITVRLTDQNGSPVSGASIGTVADSEDVPSVSIGLLEDTRVPGRYVGTLTGLTPGTWRISPTGDTVDRLLPQAEESGLTEALVTVSDSGSPELLNTRCNVTLLQQIAEATGGQVLPPTAIDEVLRLSSLEQEVRERVERQALWNRWSLLTIAFGCLCTEWVVRKRLGLA